ncbi:MAG: hypothetical protein GWO87_02440 [Xanthomonadaceae bacterium]|nr:hypothetical protein [Rhodospirillaceae bacterium]NIA18023.1 hypothetical protein [Xanthomonadaceae bacterium]
MSFKNNLKRGVLFGFVPHPLKIKERSELNVFPFNVLFMQYGTRDGRIITGTAIYEPDLKTFKQNDNKCSIEYHNIYGDNCWLLIQYDETKENYFGEKFVNEKSVMMADGTEWNIFFIHFTMGGLFKGEACKIEILK